MPRVLIIEDDPAIRQGLQDNLEIEGYEVQVCGDGESALASFKERGCDLLILDLMLPRMSGYEVCRRLRESGDRTPILMLSSRGEEADRVLGLDLGADDYVAKPFSVPELLARVRALLRRAGAARVLPESVEFDGVVVDFARFEASRDGQAVSLTRKEYALLRHLASREGFAVTRDELLNEVWGHDAQQTTRTVDTHVASLRAKLEADPARPRHLLTIHGVGYKFVGKPAA